MVNAHDIHALAGPYALGALPEDERRLFDAHLRVCEACRQEVRGLIETATRLGTATAEPPPARLHDAVVSEIDRTAQLPPTVDELTARRRRPARPAVWFAAACLVVAVAAGAVAIRAQHQADLLRTEQARVAAVLSAPDAHVAKSVPTAYGRGMLMISHQRDQLVFTLANARALPGSRTYQLWYVSPQGRMRSAALLSQGREGARYAFASSVGNARQIGLTVEPAGGSKQPTMRPIMAVPLT